MPAIGAAAAERDRREVHEREDEELDASRDGEEADERDGERHAREGFVSARRRTATATRNTGYASASDIRYEW